MLRQARQGNPRVPWRLAWIALGLITATAVAAVVVVVVAGCGASSDGARPAGRTPRDSGDGAAISGRRCPVETPHTIVSSRSGATRVLVPGRPIAVLLCRYEGFQEPGMRTPGFGLLGSRRLTGVAAAKIAARMDAVPKERPGAVNCPSDDGSSVLAVFVYGAGASDPVQIGLQGCRTITNGPTSRLAFDAAFVARVVALTRSSSTLRRASEATIEGRVRACSGTAPGGCRPADRQSRLVVRVFGPDGASTDLAGIGRTAGFRLDVVPGRSCVEHIHDGWDGHPHIGE